MHCNARVVQAYSVLDELLTFTLGQVSGGSPLVSSKVRVRVEREV